MTATRSATCAAVARSWVIMRMPTSCSSRSRSSRSRIAGAHRDVEHRDRLVGDQQAGAQHEAAGDGDALALAAGELVRVALGEGLDGRQADLLEGVVDERLLGLPGRRKAVDAQRLGDEVACAQARVEDGVGVLVDELGAAPQGAQLAARERGHVLAVEQHGAGGRIEEAQGGEGHGRLAGARLADQSEELAAVEKEADPVDGARHLAAAAREAVAEGAPEREVHGEVADLEEVLGGGRSDGRGGAHESLPSASAWQATTWPSPSELRAHGAGLERVRAARARRRSR